MKIIFAGTPAFALPPLEALLHSSHEIIAVYTQPDRKAGRGQKILFSPVKQFAIENHLPVVQPMTLRDPQAQETLKSLQPDLMIVAAYGLLLPQAVLTIPRLGCVNIHASLLPRWRGAAPIQRAILAGDTTSGITLMQMDAGLDTGPELHRISCQIKPRETAQHLHDTLSTLGAQALMEILPAIAAGDAKLIPQDESLATYAPKIEKEEACIDWKQPALFLDRLVRAFNPWPIAFTHLDNQLVRVWDAIALNTPTTHAPGTLLEANKQGMDVATGQGILRLLKLQLPGGKPLSVAEILNAKKNNFFLQEKYFNLSL